jgi:Xaa-Pro aminopeptidase
MFMGLIKTQREISLIKKAAEISDSCLPLIEKSLREGISEEELRRRVNRNIRSKHATLSFQTLVASGKRSSMIHAKPHATGKIVQGIGYIDFGACYRGYRSDVTVPYIKGKVGERERAVVKTTIKAYDIAVNSAKIGMPCWKLFEIADKFLRKNGFRMEHSLGHGVGKKTHELPYIGKPSKKHLTKKRKRRWERLKKIKFQEGMVFTIEPGVYVNGKYGCRLENDFLITKDGPKVLSHSKLIEV